MHRVVRVGAAKDAGVATRLSQLDLSRPGDSPGRTEERRLRGEAEHRFGLVEIADKCRIVMQKRWNIAGIVIADLMSASLDRSHDIRLTQGAVADEKESGFGAVALQDVQNLRRKSRVRAIIERKRNKALPSAHAVNDVRREPLERREQPKWLCPKQRGTKQRKGACYSN